MSGLFFLLSSVDCKLALSDQNLTGKATLLATTRGSNTAMDPTIENTDDGSIDDFVEEDDDVWGNSGYSVEKMPLLRVDVASKKVITVHSADFLDASKKHKAVKAFYTGNVTSRVMI